MRKWGRILAALVAVHLVIIAGALLFKNWTEETGGDTGQTVLGAAENVIHNMEMLADMGQSIISANSQREEGPKGGEDSGLDKQGDGSDGDSSGQIQMTEQELIERGKVIYLTFDDGPSAHTAELLDILAKYNVKATFFVTGGYETYFDMIAREKEEGHSIGMHCYNHDYKKVSASEEAYFEDLQKIDDLIYEQTGERTKLIRFPGGGSNISSKFNPGIMTTLTAKVEEMGYRYFDWNVLSGDAGDTKDTEEIIQNVIEGVQKKDIAVVLQHDTHDFSIAAVEEIIIWGLENGYTFLPLSMDSPTIHHSVAN